MTHLDERIASLQREWAVIYAAARERSGLGPDHGGFVALLLDGEEMAVRVALNAALAERGELP